MVEKNGQTFPVLERIAHRFAKLTSRRMKWLFVEQALVEQVHPVATFGRPELKVLFGSVDPEGLRETFHPVGLAVEIEDLIDEVRILLSRIEEFTSRVRVAPSTYPPLDSDHFVVAGVAINEQKTFSPAQHILGCLALRSAVNRYSTTCGVTNVQTKPRFSRS